MDTVQHVLVAVAENNMTTSDLDYWCTIDVDTDINVYHYGNLFGATLYPVVNGDIVTSGFTTVFCREVGDEPISFQEVKNIITNLGDK
jgi:hypothetical protein